MKHQITDEEMRRFLKMQEFSLEFDQVIADGDETWVDSKGNIRTFEEAMKAWRKS